MRSLGRWSFVISHLVQVVDDVMAGMQAVRLGRWSFVISHLVQVVDDAMAGMQAVRLGRWSFVISHLVQVVDGAMAGMQVVSPGFQSFRFQSYSNYPTLSITIPHECSFNGHVTPNAIEQISVVVHRVLSVDEMRTYAVGRAFHSTLIVEYVDSIVRTVCRQASLPSVLQVTEVLMSPVLSF